MMSYGRKNNTVDQKIQDHFKNRKVWKKPYLNALFYNL